MANKIDNLTPEASASEMEQAIKEFSESQTEVVEPELTEPVKEVVKEAPETTEPEKEVVEEKDEFDYKKGYEGLRSWNTKLSQKMADIERLLETKASETKQPEVSQKQITQNEWNDWYQQDPVAANAYLTQLNLQPLQQELREVKSEITNYKANTAISRFKDQHDDFNDYKNDILEEISLFPKPMLDDPQYFDVVLDRAYWSVKGKKSKDMAEKIRAEERANLKQKQESKKDAFVEGSTKASVEMTLDPGKLSSDELMALMRSKGLVRD